MQFWEVNAKNIFEEVKQNVTTRQAAEFYGVTVSRNGMALCPFHEDRHPSMKVDRRFHCFGCQADGDVIDFTARLFDLKPREAALKLARDFYIPLEGKAGAGLKEQMPRAKISEHLCRLKEEQYCLQVLCKYLHMLERWEREYAPAKPEEACHPLFAEALKQKPVVNYLLDTLMTGSKEERSKLAAEYGREVKNIDKRIAELGIHTTSSRQRRVER